MCLVHRLIYSSFAFPGCTFDVKLLSEGWRRTRCILSGVANVNVEDVFQFYPTERSIEISTRDCFESILVLSKLCDSVDSVRGSCSFDDCMVECIDDGTGVERGWTFRWSSEFCSIRFGFSLCRGMTRSSNGVHAFIAILGTLGLGAC